MASSRSWFSTIPEVAAALSFCKSSDEPHSEEKTALCSKQKLSFSDRVLEIKRLLASLSYHLYRLPLLCFITDVVIPYFKDQCHGHQFAVVLLLSETDHQDIYDVKFIPQDYQGKPLIDSSQPTMPQPSDYCNYIVARPTRRPNARQLHRHSEKHIFGNSGFPGISRFDLLWNAYVRKHLADPDYILIYSWNLPCCECADVIINSLSKGRYKGAKVILAHTKKWSRETSAQHEKSWDKLVGEGIVVEEVN